jgi:hypothetical protein
MAIDPESRELTAARRSLETFEQGPDTPAALGALAVAVETLVNLCESSSDEVEQKIARNLLATYARKAEERADQLLTDFDSIPDEDVKHCHDVMDEFGGASAMLPESFRVKRNDLLSRLVRRLVAPLTPYERQKQLQKALEILRDKPSE